MTRIAGPTTIARLLTGVFSVALVGALFVTQPGCVRVVLAASVEKADVLSQLAADFARTRPSVDLRCVQVRVVEKASGDAEEALARGWEDADGPRPDIWSPAATTWVKLLERHRASAGRPTLLSPAMPSIIQSPLVIAMPERMARELGWPDRSIGWSDIFSLAQDPRGWGRYGHTEWGAFKLGKTNPLISTSGLHALIATYLASGSAVDDASTRAFVRGVESSVVHYGDTVRSFLRNLVAEDDRGEALTYVSAIAVEEKQVWDYNEGNAEFRVAATGLPPREKLVAVHPREGTLIADHPYVVLDAPWVDDLKRRAAAAFLDHLRSDAVQGDLMRRGFRGHRGEVGEWLARSKELNATALRSVLSLPEPALLERIQGSWSDLRKRARVAIAIDLSRSMGERIADTKETKLALAERALMTALSRFVREDEVALWTFGGDAPREVVRIGPMHDREAQLQRELEHLSVAGTRRPLYAAVNDVVGAVRQGFDGARINAVIVLTDGGNDDPTNSDLQELLRALRNQPAGERIRVFTIGYGKGADLDALDRIARASQGVLYPALDPKIIQRVLLDVMSNF